jgi:predicted RecB family nuclease
MVFHRRPSADQSIDRIPRLRAESRKHLRDAGISTLSQIAAMQASDLRRFRGIKSSAEGIHAQVKALIDEQPVWYRPLPERLITGGWMMDIETVMPDNQDVWSIGWCDCAGDVKNTQTVQIVVVNPRLNAAYGQRLVTLELGDGASVFVVPDPDSAWRVFAEAVTKVGTVPDAHPIFHWSPFDHAVMKAYAPEDVKRGLSGRMVDLCHAFDQTVKCPIPRLSLKVVAPHIAPGFDWAEEADVFWAARNYHLWLVDGYAGALARACSYQRDDVIALRLVWEWLVNNHPEPTDR